jgi:hypothetical protein
VTTPPASALVAGGVAGTFGPDVGNELNDAVRIAPMADGRIIVAIAIWTGVTAPTRAGRKNATRWTRCGTLPRQSGQGTGWFTRSTSASVGTRPRWK